MKFANRRSDCPISFGLDIFGDKWTFLILRDMLFYGRNRFSDFTPREHMASNILADRLTRLEQAEVITKKRDQKLKNQFIYDVTEKGRELLPTLVEMSLWGLAYDGQTPVSSEFIERIRANKNQVAKEMTKAVETNTFLEYRQTHMGIPSQA